MTHLARALWPLSGLLPLTFALSGADWNWQLPQGFPKPRVPADNPMTAAKVEFGRHLFYDKRMSVNGKESCASCHKQELAFTDGRAKAEGTTGQLHPRSSMSLVNVAYAPTLTWAHPALDSLEEQALVPMLGENPIELGLKGHEAAFLTVVRTDPTYQRLFPQAFPGDGPVALQHVRKALAAFERSIVSMRSPYDRYRWQDDPNAISESAKRGEILFSSGERGGCFQCHGGWNFSSVRFEEGARRAAAPSCSSIPVYQAMILQIADSSSVLASRKTSASSVRPPSATSRSRPHTCTTAVWRRSKK